MKKIPWNYLDPHKSIPVTDGANDSTNVNGIGIEEGYHTIETLERLPYSEAAEYLEHIKVCNLFIRDGPIEKHGSSLYHNFRSTRIGPKGVYITLRTSKIIPPYIQKRDLDYTEHEEPLTCGLYVRINPKILCGINDYITPATQDIVKKMRDAFDDVCQKVSPIMRDASYYQVRRVDACVNVVVHDLDDMLKAIRVAGRDVDPRMIMFLIRHGDIPKGFKQYVGGETNDRSCYLYCKSCIVNFYCKGDEMDDWLKNVPKGDLAHDVVRLEVQQLYGHLSGKLSTFERMFDNAVETVCSDEWNFSTVCRYWGRVVGKGDWYSYRNACNYIRNTNMRSDRQERLIGILDIIQKYGSIYDAKRSFEDNVKRKEFINSLNDLRSLGINGVCIPDEWNIGWIPNILESWMKQRGA